MGYHRAGFEVVGVDINPHPNYPFEFHQADALYFPLNGFDVIHASPPCQAHSSLTSLTSTKTHVDLIPETRRRIQGYPYVIENVPHSPLINPIILCGTNFGLAVARHRLFESNLLIVGHNGCNHNSRQLYTVLTKSCRKIGDMRGKSSHSIGKRAMGIDWMTQFEMGLAIPPAYTEHIGNQIKRHITNASSRPKGRAA